jgi:hypothetical protein
MSKYGIFIVFEGSTRFLSAINHLFCVTKIVYDFLFIFIFRANKFISLYWYIKFKRIFQIILGKHRIIRFWYKKKRHETITIVLSLISCEWNIDQISKTAKVGVKHQPIKWLEMFSVSLFYLWLYEKWGVMGYGV